ncbi:hypothetical protein J7438_13945 [Thalassotalea sp. G20_0]|uniref:hypothetical protein n=1 Tax=Thalassotalea sp. G20_0 TaxID=2821093 RepID=UPI001ADBFCA2|nr:hypothetical protein [Thalassotalea sp. G20_0]MBO9495180.1 hypothetical protein [Thalassotalea sp. G20_0]
MSPSIAVNSTLFAHSLPPEHVYHNDEPSEEYPNTTTEACSQSNAPSGKSDGLAVRTCEVIEETETFISRVKRHGKCLLSKVPGALCTPLKVCTTLLHAGIFAGYYVTVMTITGIGALTGAMTGVAAAIKASIRPCPAEKSFKEYTVSHAQKVFKWLALPYETLPETFKGSIFPAIASVALFIVETVTIPGKQLSIHVYENICQATYQATKPYKPVTDMTVKLFDTTKRWIQN